MMNKIKFTKEKLEYMYSILNAENYSAYDYEKNFNMSKKEVFQEHFERFKPTLDLINSSRDFAKADFENLITTPYNSEVRRKYLNDLLPNFDRIPIVEEYGKVLQYIDYNPRNLKEVASFVASQKNIDFINNTFLETIKYGNNILKHPDIQTIIDILSNKLANCTAQQLEVLNHVCTTYEQFGLVTFEPYLVVCIGNVLFVKVFIPLHRAGAFSLFMNKVIEKQLTLRANIIERLTLTSNWFTKLSITIKPAVNSLLNICNNSVIIKNPIFRGITLFLGNYLFYSINNMNNNTPLLTNEPNNNIVSQSANRFIEESKTLDNSVTNFVEYSGKQLGYLVGKAGRSLVKGILLGAISNSEDAIKETAKKIDNYIDNKKI